MSKASATNQRILEQQGRMIQKQISPDFLDPNPEVTLAIRIRRNFPWRIDDPKVFRNVKVGDNVKAIYTEAVVIDVVTTAVAH